jgi:3-oxoacyl-[acyl-carrier protein] reductase
MRLRASALQLADTRATEGNMDLRIRGKVAIVTGASAGIGRAIACELAENGVNVVLVARGAARLEATAIEIAGRYGTRTLAVPADVAQVSEPARVVERADKELGGVDILVNNAGRAHAGGLLQATEADWADMTETKLSAMRRFCQAVVPPMRARGWGRIVNISSIGGIYPNPKLLVSHTLSAAINNLTRGFALEVARDGILVNAVGLGAVLTDNWQRNMIPAVRKRRPELASASDEEIVKQLGAEMTPIGRFAQPEEIAAIVAFLASARNSFITGDTIEASGGADRFM